MISRQQAIHRKLFIALVTTAMISLAGAGHSNARKKSENVKQEMQEAGRDTKRAAGKTYRKAKDKTCELVNGKMECAAEKMKHGAQDAGDKTQDAID